MGELGISDTYVFLCLLISLALVRQLINKNPSVVVWRYVAWLLIVQVAANEVVAENWGVSPEW